jgi:hypothetical protein
MLFRKPRGSYSTSTSPRQEYQQSVQVFWAWAARSRPSTSDIESMRKSPQGSALLNSTHFDTII